MTKIVFVDEVNILILKGLGQTCRCRHRVCARIITNELRFSVNQMEEIASGRNNFILTNKRTRRYT